MKKILLGLFLCLLGTLGVAQNTGVSGTGMNYVAAGAPTGSCSQGDLYTDSTTNNLYYCKNGSWVQTSGSGGGGTVTPSGTLTNAEPIFGAGTTVIQAGLVELWVDAFSGSDFGTQANNAIAALPSTGGTIRFSCKNYSASSTTIAVGSKPNVTLQGCGGQDAAAFSTGATTLNFAAGVSGITSSGSATQIRDIVLTSASTGAGSDNGISFAGGKPMLWDVGVHHFGGVGILLGNNTDRWRFDTVEAGANFGDGFQTLTGTSDTNIGFGTNLSSALNGGYGYNILSGGGNVFIDTHATTNTTGGWFVHGVDNYFYGTYIETGTGSSFTFDTGTINNTVVFTDFGYPSTYTDNGTTNVQIKNGKIDAVTLARSIIGSSVSGTDTISLNTSPTFPLQTQPGTTIRFSPAGSNTTTSVTLAVNGLTALPVEKSSPSGPVNLAAGDLLSTLVAQVTLDPSHSIWILTNPATVSTVTPGGAPSDLQYYGTGGVFAGDSKATTDGAGNLTVNTLGAGATTASNGQVVFNQGLSGDPGNPSTGMAIDAPTGGTITPYRIEAGPLAACGGYWFMTNTSGLMQPSCVSAPAINFNQLTTGTNTTATMTVGTGASLTTSGSGTISATTAANLSGTPALPNGTTATTQAAGDSSTKLATDAFVINNLGTTPITTTSLTDYFCSGLNTSGNVGQLGWTSTNAGSTAVLAGVAGTYPHRCLFEYRTATGATQGQGGMLSLGAGGAQVGWGDFTTNTNWSMTLTFSLNSATSSIMRFGVGTTGATTKPTSLIGLVYDTNNPMSAAAISGIVCTTTSCTVTTTSPHGLTLPGQSFSITGETCPTRNLNATYAYGTATGVATIPTNSTFTFTLAGAAETCTVQGTTSSIAQTNFGFISKTDNTHVSVVDSGVAADTSFHTITISSTVAGSFVYKLDSASPVTISTNGPTSTLTPMVIIGTDVTAQKIIQLNYFTYIETGVSR